MSPKQFFFLVKSKIQAEIQYNGCFIHCEQKRTLNVEPCEPAVSARERTEPELLDGALGDPDPEPRSIITSSAPCQSEFLDFQCLCLHLKTKQRLLSPLPICPICPALVPVIDSYLIN